MKGQKAASVYLQVGVARLNRFIEFFCHLKFSHLHTFQLQVQEKLLHAKNLDNVSQNSLALSQAI